MSKRTSQKLWARLYRCVFGVWPQKVVDERMEHVAEWEARVHAMAGERGHRRNEALLRERRARKSSDLEGGR